MRNYWDSSIKELTILVRLYHGGNAFTNHYFKGSRTSNQTIEIMSQMSITEAKEVANEASWS